MPNSCVDRMVGTVTAYNKTTGGLSVDVGTVEGFGPSSKWMIDVTDPSLKPSGKFLTHSWSNINVTPGKVDLNVDKDLGYFPGQNVTMTANHAGFSWLEISVVAGFVGLFLAVVLNALTKASLVPVNNPYLKESIQTHTIK